MNATRRSFLAAGLGIIAATTIVVAMSLWRTASLERQHLWETRFSLVSLKLQGRLPYVGWTSILSRVGPEWYKSGPPPLARIVGGGARPCPALWDTPMGRFWGTEHDGRDLDWIVMEQIGWHIYDRGAAKVRPGDIVFDVGAHLGTFSRFALDRGASKVVLFEPQPGNARCLERTFAREIADGRAVLVEAAVWHSTGSLSFATEGPGTMGHVDTSGRPPDVTVDATTFDETIRRLRLPRVNFVKMDIEGAERHALAGGRRMLEHFRPRMAICIYHMPDDRTVIPRLVLEANPQYRQFTRSGFQAYFY
jgi:FkbM family methyltransferase